MICVFTGPAPLAEMVREELLKRGVGAELRSANEGLFAGLYGLTMAPAGEQSVMTREDLVERHRAAIDEVLALVSEPTETPGRRKRRL